MPVRSVNSHDNARPVLAHGGEPYRLATYFTTDGSGDETIGSSEGGRVTVARSAESGEENYYTVSFGSSWEVTHACVVDHALAATVNVVKVIDKAEGTVELQFSGAIASNRVDLILEVSASSAR